MKRLLLALAITALLVWFTMPALASQNKPVDPIADLSIQTKVLR